jgi:glycosyltransferase involved in cell wall biosynthesis
LRAAFPDLAEPAARAALWGNLLVSEDGIFQCCPALLERLAEDVPEAGLPLGLYAVWSTRDDLRRAFPQDERHFSAKLLEWFRTYEAGKLENLFRLSAAFSQNLLQDSPQKTRTLPNRILYDRELDDASATSLDNQFKPLRSTFGVNLIGFPFSPTGIGEDLRMLAACLTRYNIPYSVIEDPYVTPAARSECLSGGTWRKTPDYPVNIICLPGGELFRLYAMLGNGYFRDRHTIGYMQWELPHWPEDLRNILNLLDEVWAPSSFTFGSVAEMWNGKLSLMPLPVEITAHQALSREDLRLPKDNFIFLFVFDSLSFFRRKNPLTVVQAFQNAFSKNENVSLIIKTMHTANYEAQEQIKNLYGDERIHILNQHIPKQELLSLYACCDAYVSLHRSEGFGRTIAEAMLLGKPVIVSNYSGNTDFCNQDTAFLVNGRLVPVNPGEYPFHEGQYWFDADVVQAAEQLRLCFENFPLAQKKAQAGRMLLQTNNSIKNIGEKYFLRIMDIYNNNKI